MDHLVKMAQLAAQSTAVQFRRKEYGTRDIQGFLRDVIAMANATVDGPRYIVVGVDFDKKERKRFHSVPDNDFSGKPSYAALLAEFVEPTIKVRYTAITLEGKSLGVFEIPDCPDKPYMMRIDHSETLQRGDAYVRIEDVAIKLGRKQLQSMFEKVFHKSIMAKRIEIGFPGEIIHKELRIKPIELTALPSAIASAKLKEMVSIRENSKNRGSTAVIARLTHARLFGSDNLYETKPHWELLEELAQIELQYQNDDELFLFENNAEKLQFVIYNQGEEAIHDASFSLTMPSHRSFHVANHLPKLMGKGRWLNRSAKEIADYPKVIFGDNAVRVSKSVGDIPCGEPINAFEVPLRICVGSDLKNRKIGIRYSLTGANLSHSATGTLRLLF